MKPATHEKPLPGDLVIAQCNTHPERRDAFAVFVYPNDRIPVTLPTFTAALGTAQQAARGQGGRVQIWCLEPAGPIIFQKVED